MEELLSMYGDSIKPLERGDRVEGTVLSIDPGRVVLDIGNKSEGLIAESAYDEAKDYLTQVKVGDKIKARVIVPETNEGYVILTIRDLVRKSSLDDIKNAYKEDKELPAQVTGVSDSGVNVNVLGKRGFIPMSQISAKLQGDTENLQGQNIKVKVLDLDENMGKAIFSERAVSEAELVEKERKLLKSLKEGEIYTGTVSSVSDYGAFVTISPKGKKEGVDGLVHISELSWDKVDSVEDVVHVGDEIQVKVIGKRDGKLSLSAKQAQNDPWDEAAKKIKKEDKFTGSVTKSTDYGLFVQLTPGVEGLVHMTKIPPGKSYTKGDEIKVYVEDIDIKEKRISLGLVLTEIPVGYK